MTYRGTSFEEYPKLLETEPIVARIIEIRDSDRVKFQTMSGELSSISNLLSISSVTLSNTAGINAKTVANTVIFTPVPSGRTLIVTKVVIRCTSATSITVGPTIGIGTASGTNDIFAPASLTALTGTSNIFGFELYGASVSVSAGGSIYLNLSVASTGTSQTIAVDMMGYYV